MNGAGYWLSHRLVLLVLKNRLGVFEITILAVAPYLGQARGLSYQDFFPSLVG